MGDAVILRGDGTREEYIRRPFIVVLDNLRSARNVGAIFRTADAVGVEELILCGTTAIPPHKQIEQTARGAEKHIKWSYYPHTIQAVRKFKNMDLPIYVLEVTNSGKYYWDLKYPEKMVLVLGNEALGISESVLHLSDFIIEIPMTGYKNSLNVASAFSVVAFEILHQHF